jgi:hypothetical protein
VSKKAKLSNGEKGQILKENLPKYIKILLKYHKMLYVLLTFCQNRPKKIQFSSGLKKAKKRPNGQIISRKLYQKRPNKAVFAF